MGQDDEGRKQRAQRRSGVAAHLEHRLREAMMAARNHADHARGFRVKHRRTDAHQRSTHQKRRIGGHTRQRHQADEREAHANRQRIRPWPAIIEVPDERLQQGRSNLIGQRDHPDLPEVQVEGRLQQRINRRDQRLNHVVQEVAEGCREQNRKNQFLCDMFRRFGLSRASS